MLKRIEHITIRDYSLFEQSNDVRYLMRFMFLPRKLINSKKLESLLIGIFSNLTEKSETDKAIKREYHRMKSMYRIQMLVALHQATSNLLNQVKVNRWKEEIGKKSTELINLKKYVAQIESATGIKIEKPEDLEKLDKEIQRWVDKYKENFEVKQEKSEGKLTFMQIVMGVFASMNMGLNYEMYLNDFFMLKKEAERVAKIKTESIKK